jgi:hypothetical protein
MAPFDFNYVQDDLLTVVAERPAMPVRLSFDTPQTLAPARVIPVSHPPISAPAPILAPILNDTTLRAMAADRAATIRYDTKIVSNSFAEVLLELLDRNSTLTSVVFIVCYVGLLRSL